MEIEIALRSSLQNHNPKHGTAAVRGVILKFALFVLPTKKEFDDVVGKMGSHLFRGYETTEREVYTPAVPQAASNAINDLEREIMSDEIRRGTLHRDSVHHNHQQQDQRKGSGDARKPSDELRHASASNPHADGEWLYNLDALAKEHSLRLRHHSIKPA